MKEEAAQPLFAVGQYLDYCNAQNLWVPRIVLAELQSPSHERVLKIKDPRYTIIGSENIAANSSKLQPFRTHTSLKPNTPANNYVTKWRRFESQNLAKRQLELEEFSLHLLEKTPHDIIQFLRGHHYFYADELINSQFVEQFQYAATMRFLAAHRTFLTHYLRALDFKEAEYDIYASPVSALCSAFPEMLEWTTYAVGIAIEFDAIKKDYARWHDHAVFQKDVTEWAQKELFPALIDSKHEDFPPNFLFGLFCFLNSLFSRLITSKSPQLPAIYEMLYEDLIRNLGQPLGFKELNQFEVNCDSIFKCFPLRNASESSYQSSQTEQIDMVVERSPHNSGSKDNDRSKEAQERDQMVRLKKVDFKFHLAQSHFEKNEFDRFLREVAGMASDVHKRLIEENYQHQSQWPAFIKFFVKMALESKLVEAVLGIPALQHQEIQIRNIIMKMHFFLPDHILGLLVEHEKLLLVRHLFQKTNQPIVPIEFTNKLVDRIIVKSALTESPKEYLEFYNFLERHAKDLYSVEVARPLRIKLINASFDIAATLTKSENRSLIDNIFDLNDPLRDELWAAYTLQHILPYANNHYSYFFEISINKYLNRFNVDLSTFTEICEFMKDPDIRDEKYEKRKSSVIAALHYQYRHHKDRYLEYLEVFLESFCDDNHDKSEHEWVDLYPFPKDDKNFWNLPINKEFCYHMDSLKPLHYETDIFLYLKLFLKLNVLQGKVTVNSEGQITRVLDVPDSFPDLLSCLYTSMTVVARSKMLQKEVEKYFFAAEEPRIYNLMLVDFLNTIISHEGKRTQVNVLFRRLKIRLHQIPKTAVFLASNTPRAEENLICRNVKIIEKCQELAKKLEMDELFLPLYQEERNKIKIDVPLYRTELLKTIRVRIGSRLLREPADILLLLDGKPLQQEKYNLSFQDVYYHMDPESPKGTSTIEYQFNPHIPPIRDALLNKIVNLINLLPNTIALLKGVDIVQEDWNEVFHLQMLKKMLEGNLQRNDLMESDLKVSHKLDFLLDFYIWKLDRQQYSFRPLIKFFKRIEGAQFIMRNYKIAYLLYQSNETYHNFQECEQIMLSLLPDSTMNTEKQEKIIDIINSNKNYESLQKIVSFLIQKAPHSLTFISTCKLYSEFQQFNTFSQIYRKLWIKIYLQTPLEEKIEFFRNFEHFMVLYPDNMRDFYMIISYQQLLKDAPFYQDLIAQFTTILLRLNKPNLTLNEVKSIEILISNISELSDESKIFHPILHSRELAEFVKSHIYQLSERTQRELMNLMKIMVASPQSRAILTEFFARQTREQDWTARPTLIIKSLSKTPQFEGRVGLKNPHSVCYANSFLQQLYHIEIFRDEMLETPFTQNSSSEQDIIYQLKKTFLNLHYGRDAYFNPDFFKAFKNFDGEQTNIQIQMDVDQFRNLLFDRIQHSIPSTNNFVNTIFNGKQKTIIKSQECQHVSSKDAEVFSSLCVDVKGCKNLQQSLDHYFKPQMLDGDNAYFCDQCQKKLAAQKTIQIESLPPYLTFVLKRFEYGALVRSKINSYFQFPFDNFQYFPGKRYRLKGVIVHIGVAETGHYVSFAKHNGVWYLFNDGIVTEADEQKVKDVSFGLNPKSPGYNREQSKNAYVIIYEAEDAPKRQEALQRNFYGVSDEYRRIVKNRILSNKERLYFSSSFLQTLNYIAEQYSEPATLHLLFWNLLSIHVRLKQPIKYEILRKSFIILKKNKAEFSSLWSQNEIERVIQLFTCQMNPEYKSIMIQILVDNCEQYCPNVERILQICLKRIYQDKDNIGYYMFMHLMAKKFGEACKFLNKQRIVGRVLDILLLGVIGQRVRQALKNSCDVEFQMISFNSRTFKQVQRAFFKYHKWALVTTVLEYCNFDLHEIEKQHYVFQNTYINLGHLTSEATDKASIKFVSKYFAIVCKHNNQYFTRLIQYITEQLKDKDDFRKYMKILKDLCFIEDELTEQRNRTAAILFQKYLKRLYEDKKEQLFILAWQWFIEIAKINFFFRKIIKQFTSLFEPLANVIANNFGIYRNRFQDSHSKLNHTKHHLYGIIGPTSLRQTQLLITKKNAEMSQLLRDENDIHDSNDYDGDIVQKNLEDGQIILKYDDYKTKFTKVAVQFSYGDLLIIQLLDKNDRERQNGCGLVVFSRGDQKLRLKTLSIADELVIEPNADQIDSEEPSNHTSTRQI